MILIFNIYRLTSGSIKLNLKKIDNSLIHFNKLKTLVMKNLLFMIFFGFDTNYMIAIDKSLDQTKIMTIYIFILSNYL